MNRRIAQIIVGFFLAGATVPEASGQDKVQWVEYTGPFGTGAGMHIVLISGDAEYRSEEALPQLGKILAKRHGFKCTVLFAIDPKTGEINPNVKTNIPGLEALKTADLMLVAMGNRNLPDSQMKHIAEYLKTDKPVIGLRPALGAFAELEGDHAKFNNATEKDYEGGFGRQILGEKWLGYYATPGTHSTRVVIHPYATRHPVVKGVKDGDIWSATAVLKAYPVPNSFVLAYGQTLEGVKPADPAVKGKLNAPWQPIAWQRHIPKKRIITTTLGTAQDLESPGMRRLLVNAVYFCVGFEKAILTTSNVDIVGEYRPSPSKLGAFKKDLRPSSLAK